MCSTRSSSSSEVSISAEIWIAFKLCSMFSSSKFSTSLELTALDSESPTFSRLPATDLTISCSSCVRAGTSPRIWTSWLWRSVTATFFSSWIWSDLESKETKTKMRVLMKVFAKQISFANKKKFWQKSCFLFFYFSKLLSYFIGTINISPSLICLECFKIIIKIFLKFLLNFSLR
jgi:hypothetical protein